MTTQKFFRKAVVAVWFIAYFIALMGVILGGGLLLVASLFAGTYWASLIAFLGLIAAPLFMLFIGEVTFSALEDWADGLRTLGTLKPNLKIFSSH